MDFGIHGFHPGEENMQRLLRVPSQNNPTNLYLPPRVSSFLSTTSMLVVGTTSPSGQPWTSLLTGIPGFVHNVAPGALAIQATIAPGDPIYETFNDEGWGPDAKEGVKRGEGMIAGLGINLERRQRIKLYGRSDRGMRRIEREKGMATFVMKIEQTMGNCPKYMNARHLDLVPVNLPANLTDIFEVPPSLPQEALNLIERSDMFFVASRNGFTDMDVNHRGGPPGFVRVIPSTTSGSSDAQEPTSLIWPEYSGNRLYQTLGNLKVTPLAGLTFPDYNTGDMLYLTGTVEILVGDEAESLMRSCKLGVKFTVTAARYSKASLGVRLAETESVGWSPYNPMVRYLTNEQKGQKLLGLSNGQSGLTVRLLKKVKITDTVARFTFQLGGKRDKTQLWKAGQYAMLGFEDELSSGYRHMDDSDPQGLNDDYIRSFTISSPPDKFQGRDDGKFEMTIRKNGPVTRHLFQQNPGSVLEATVQGFGGDFFVEKCEGGKIGIVVAGVGITPFMAQWQDIMKSGLDVKLFWTVKEADLPFIKDTIETCDGMREALRLFVTGQQEGEAEKEISAQETYYRRIQMQDVVSPGDETRKWYICTSLAMQKEVVGWLDGREVSWEEFTY
ncbi:hypothetical protein ABW20_dc0103683 [Dactylellina cionopaga]|nr:hypothetical protein ABW20_dc0103683 [Dactylellina cionopaga]